MLQLCRMPRAYLASTRYTGRPLPEAPLIVFINSRSGGRAGPRLTEVLCRALGQAQASAHFVTPIALYVHAQVKHTGLGGCAPDVNGLCQQPGRAEAYRGALETLKPGPGKEWLVGMRIGP